MRTRGLSILLLPLALLLGCASGAPSKAKVGQTLYVSTYRSLPLQVAPTAFSADAGALNYGTPVRVLALVDTWDKAAPIWVQIQAGTATGYVPRGSLATPELFRRQGSGDSSVGDKADQTGVSRGFSETVKPDMTSMRGGVGSGRAGAANYKAIDEIINAHMNENPRDQNAGFRREGKLGEFRNQ